MAAETIPWMVSCHGGHSKDYCDHAYSSLREILDTAIERGFSAFGITEHAPRFGDRFLYDTEIEMNWTVDLVAEKFEQYAADSRELQLEYAGRLNIVRGFEAEVVPSENYVEIMSGIREKHDFEFMVGSVHYVDEWVIDYTTDKYVEAAEAFGGIESLAIRYYELVAEMVSHLKPEVVGHLDLIRKMTPDREAVRTPRVQQEAIRTLEAIKQHGGILDINTAPYRRGDDVAYPEPWLLRAAAELEIPVVFGDDSHMADQVGEDIDRARDYLLDTGIREVHLPGQTEGIPLEA